MTEDVYFDVYKKAFFLEESDVKGSSKKNANGKGSENLYRFSEIDCCNDGIYSRFTSKEWAKVCKEDFGSFAAVWFYMGVICAKNAQYMGEKCTCDDMSAKNVPYMDTFCSNVWPWRYRCRKWYKNGLNLGCYKSIIRFLMGIFFVKPMLDYLSGIKNADGCICIQWAIIGRIR